MSRASKYLRKKLSEGGDAGRPPKPNLGDYPGPQAPGYVAALEAYNNWTPPEDNTPAAETPTAPVNTSPPAQTDNTTVSNTRPPKPSSADYPDGARDPAYTAAMNAYNTWTPPETTTTPATTTPPTETVNTDVESDTTSSGWTIADGKPDFNKYQGGAPSAAYKADLAAWNNSQEDNSGDNQQPPTFNNGDPKPTVEDFNGNIALYKAALVAWNAAQGSEDSADVLYPDSDDDREDTSSGWTIADGKPDFTKYQGGAPSAAYKADLAAWNKSQEDNSESNTAPQGPETTDEEEDTTTTPVANDEGVQATDSAPTIPAYDPDDFENSVDFEPTGTAMPAFQGPFGSPGEAGQAMRSFTDYFDMDGDGKVSLVERDYQRSVISGRQIDHEAPLQFKDRAGKPNSNDMSDDDYAVAFADWTIRNDEYHRIQEETYDFVRTWHNRGGAEEGNTNNQADNPTSSGSDGGDNNTGGGDNTGGGGDNNTGGGDNNTGDNNNNSENDDMSNPEQTEGSVDTTENSTTIKKAASGAPVKIEQDSPTVTAPTVGVEKVIGDKPKASDFSGPGGGKAFAMATEEYNAKLAETTSSDAQIEALDDAVAIERTENDKVSPTEIVAAQMGTRPLKPKASDYTGPGGGKAFEMANEKYADDLARYEKGIEVDAPIAKSAASMTASTIGQELPIKPLGTDFAEDEEGRRKLAAAREAFNVQIEELRGEKRPKFHEFNGNREAYNQALKDFHEAPLPVTEEVKAAQGSIEEGSKALATQADGTVSEGSKATAAARNTVTEEAALASTKEFKEDADSTVKAVTGKVATVEEWKDSTAAEAREGELPVKPLPTDFEGGATSEAYKQAQSEYNTELEDIRGMPFPKRENYDSTAEFNAAKKKFQEEPYMAREALQREAIVGEPATGEAAEIMSMYDYNQSQKRAIQGADAKKAAVKKLKAAGLADEAIAQRLADEPNLIADEMEDMPEDVRTTLSGLPKEALIDVQMESLMSGMEDGEVPAWARPALAKVEANLAKRGMTASSVGRDALFNAIIQSAIPMAQANASAIQGATAQDKQIAADFLAKNAGFQQQMNLANMSNDQQMRLANLTAQNQASSENLNAKQQIELTNLNAKLQTNLLQGKIAAEMGVAQLNVDQQTAVVNAQTSAGIDMAKYNAAQQVELTNSKFMQTMVATKFNADQQAAMQNATAMASMDLANLDKNTKLAVTNAQAFLQMDMANLSNEQQASVLTAQQRQQALLSNQSAENASAQFNAANQQQADQFMQNLGVQVEQYNASANSARDQFNTTEKNRIAALNAGNELQAQQFEAQLDTDIAKFNETQDFQRDQWNAANAQAVEQSNVQWRRQSNLADTAAQNAANQQNAQISYNLTSQELTQVWQQMRDEAAYIRQSFENEEQRKAQLLATAIGNEKLAEKFDKGANQKKWLDEISSAIN